MQAKHLGWKFLAVGLGVALSAMAIWTQELRLGIDLKGGNILTFEIRSKSDADQRYIQEQTISRLKERIDPNGLYSTEWRPVGKNRFEVRMPLGTERAQKARQDYLAALARLEAGNIALSEIRRVRSLTDKARADEIAALSGGDPQRHAALEKMASAGDALLAAEEALKDARAKGLDATSAVGAYDDAKDRYEDALAEVLKTNIRTEELRQIQDLYVTDREKTAVAKKDLEERSAKRSQHLARLKAEHPRRAALIDAVMAAHIDWAEKRTGLDDPADLKRLVAKAGVLEFRIAAAVPDSKRQPTLSTTDYDMYLHQLHDEGPLAGHARNDPFQWFLVRDKGERLSPDMVLGKYGDKRYALLSNRPNECMLRESGRGGWSLESARPAYDNLGRPAVGFGFDARGAKMMGALTSANVTRLMAILLDGEVYSAPYIKEAIYQQGQITGDFSQKQVNELVKILNAGSLLGQVNENPVNEQRVDASMGKDNRDAGIRAAIWGLISVAVFMMIYYLGAGAIANVALMLNLIFVLGAMCFIQAVFTLPGIAGVILTIGMAVDANVLIYERLREEQAKIQSMGRPTPNAYSSAARAILDSNVTTLLTCLILGWVGTEEVRGFAITLGLGVAFSLFTALVVTRWIFLLLLEAGWIKQHIRMVAFIGTPRINWMAKRRIFWTASIVLVAAGMVALGLQGGEVLGLEFSSGARAGFSFRRGAMLPGQGGEPRLPQRAEIEEALKATALRKARSEKDPAEAAQLTRFAQTAKVETLLSADKAGDLFRPLGLRPGSGVPEAAWLAAGCDKAFFQALDADKDNALSPAELANAPERGYQVSTTVANVDLLRGVIQEAFGETLDTTPAVKFTLQTAGPVPGTNLALDPKDGGITHVASQMAEKVSREFRDRFTDATGGAMFVISDVTPPLTEAALADRIQTIRMQPDFADFQFNRSIVIGLAADPARKGFRSLAVLAANPGGVDYASRPQQWKEFAANEGKLLDAALQREESLARISEFDPAVAGETAQLAVIAFVLSWLAIIVYLWIRFGSFRWGLAAVVCLIHDALIAVGMVAISAYLCRTALGPVLGVHEPFKIDMAVVAAVLTIIGYSVNDTIVVFDRIRENRGRLTTVDENTINRSINQTISRSLLTSFTTLLVVLVMYVFGGPGIHGFNFVLLVGIVVGTYSSIAIASPLLLGFKHALAGQVTRTPAAPPPAARMPQPSEV